MRSSNLLFVGGLSGLTLFAGVALVGACGGGDSGGGSPDNLVGSGTGGSGTGGSAGTAGTGGDPEAGAPETDAAPDLVDEPAPCGAEKQACCNDTTCTDPGLTCADHFCLICNALPTPSPGCTNVALGVVPTALQTNPDNPLAYATDGSSCTAWGSGDYVNIADSGVTGTWWQLDLGSIHPIDSMMLWMEQTPPDVMVRLRIETSTDGAAWVSFHDPAEFTMLLHANEPWLTPFHDATGHAIALRFLKITFLESESWISIRELALFECPSDAGM
jgi:hypothetical protein